MRPDLSVDDFRKPGKPKSAAVAKPAPLVEEKPWTVTRFLDDVVGDEAMTTDQAVVSGMELGCKMNIAKGLFKAAVGSGRLEQLLKVPGEPKRFKVKL